MYTITNYIAKGAYLLLVLSIEAEHIAYVFLKYYYLYYGLLVSLISNRGP